MTQLTMRDGTAQDGRFRLRCRHCLQPEFSCFCGWIREFDPGIDFVILIHPIEIKRRRITTGRMAHMCLRGSQLIMGQVYTSDLRVNSILNDPSRSCYLLYPGKKSANLSLMPQEARSELRRGGKRVTIFVVDGTWATAKKTVNQSLNLQSLPRICFTPPGPSTFRVRKQPRPECYSTIEAIHHTIELFGPAPGRPHDGLLDAFGRMVERQIQLKGQLGPSPSETVL